MRIVHVFSATVSDRQYGAAGGTVDHERTFVLLDDGSISHVTFSQTGGPTYRVDFHPVEMPASFLVDVSSK